MRTTWLVLAAALCAACPLQRASAGTNVVTTDTNLAYIARRVGGPLVSVESLSRGTDDPHHVDPRPSMVVKLASAKVFVRIGMDLDLWADSLLDRCGNPAVQRGGKGYADCSANLKVRDTPPGKIDPSMGDIHAYGNPHYLLDPANGILAAGNIAAALIRVDPANAPSYRANFLALGNEIKESLDRWRTQLRPYVGAEITVYHKTWAYFMSRFGLKEYAAIEPKPGVPPSPGHVAGLGKRMKADGVRAILSERFRSPRFPDLLAQACGAKTVFVPTAVGAEPGIVTYIGLFDAIVDRIAQAMR